MPIIDITQAPYNAVISEDISRILAQALLDARSQGYRTIYIPGKGDWQIDNPVGDMSGVDIIGDNESNTVLSFNFNGDLCCYSGAGGMSGGLRRLCVYRGSGFGGGAGIKLIGNNISSPDYALFEDIVVTGSGTYTYPLYEDGTARTTIQGVRDIVLRNVDLFCGQNGAAWLQNIVGHDFESVSCYPAGGASGAFYIGGGSSTNNFSNMNVQDQLNISHSVQGVFRGIINSLNTDSTGSRWYIDGLCNGSIANSLTNSYVNLK